MSFTHYPHDDTFSTGERGAGLLLRTVQGGVRPVMALAKVPIICGACNGQTFGDGPMAHLTRRARRLETQPGILSVSCFQVHPYNDLPGMGCGSIVVTDNDPALAADEAQALAAEFWARRRAFEVEHFTVTEAVARGRKVEGGPVLLVDTADCAGGGAPGDSVALLRELLALGVDEATFLMVVDPAAAQACARAGIGQTVSLQVGYSLDPTWGQPVSVSGERTPSQRRQLPLRWRPLWWHLGLDGSFGRAAGRQHRASGHVAADLRLGRRTVSQPGYGSTSGQSLSASRIP